MQIIMRTEAFAKLFFLVSVTGFVTYAILAFYTFHTAYTTMSDVEQYQDRIQGLPNPEVVAARHSFYRRIKYILIWTQDGNYNQLGEGQAPFLKHSCSYTNCFMTTAKNLLNGDYRNFDALVFDTEILRRWKNLPQKRSPHQKYIFYGMEPSDDSAICDARADKYFNWTWSYKLYSDIVSPFIEVLDLNGNYVAPAIDVQWITNMSELKKEQISRMIPKTKAVAWVMKRCQTNKKRTVFIKELQAALKEHSLVLDIYGCKNLPCPVNGCYKLIKNRYYFYLAYEDNFVEDYVTEEVLKAYHHDAVPIVKGGADYSRFLPDGSYINAQLMTAEKLAVLIDYIIRNPGVYRSFYKWKNHYTIHKTDITRSLCDLCDLLNDDKRVKIHTSYEMFRKWWYNGPLEERCYPRGNEDEMFLLSYINDTRSGIKRMI